MKRKIIGLFLLSVVQVFPFWGGSKDVDLQVDSEKRLVKFSVKVEEPSQARKINSVGKIEFQGETKESLKKKVDQNIRALYPYLINLGLAKNEISFDSNIEKTTNSWNSRRYLSATEEKWIGELTVNITSNKIALIEKLGPAFKKKYDELPLSWHVYPSFDKGLDLEFKLLEKAFAKVDLISKKIELLMKTKVKKIHQAKWKPVKIPSNHHNKFYNKKKNVEKDSHAIISLKLDVQLELED